ncbi:MAG: hypothetical protein ABI207_01950, partial [Crocinitomicaceae bacterium]
PEQDKEQKKLINRLKNQIEKLEEEISALEKEQKSLELKMSEIDYSKEVEANQLIQTFESQKKKYDLTMKDWESKVEELEQLSTSV